MRTPAVCCGCHEQIHRDYGSPVEKKEWHGDSLSEREGPDPCLDRLLLLFWAHYIEDDPHLLCTFVSRWLPFTENKGEDLDNYITE